MPQPLEELPLNEVSALRGCAVTDVATRLAPRLFGNALDDDLNISRTRIKNCDSVFFFKTTKLNRTSKDAIT